MDITSNMAFAAQQVPSVAKEDSGSAVFTDADKLLFIRRGLDEEKQKQVAEIYGQARSSVGAGQARSFLANLDIKSLSLLQEAASLADPVQAEGLSEEGAANLLLPPHELVDTNNDGLVEVGRAKIIAFPPVNAPQSVKDAWNDATKNMSESDIMSFSGFMLPLAFSGAGNEAGGAGNTYSKMSDAGFNWRKLIDDMQFSNNLSRPYNRPEMSDKIASWLTAFLEKLEMHGQA